MKKKILSILITIFALCALMFTLTACGERNEPSNSSVGLEYGIINDNEYQVNYIGTCTDTEIVIPSIHEGRPVTSIGYKAFNKCASLKSVTIPDSITRIYEGAFSGCDSLTSITLPYIGSKVGCAYIDLELLFGYNNYQDNGGIPKSLKEVIITGGEEIPINAFNNYSSLTSITILDTVKIIGKNAFYNCSSLSNITIPSSVTTIGKNAFYNCSSLSNITIPSSVTTIGSAPFLRCTSLESIKVADGNQNYKDIDGNLYNIDGRKLVQYAIGKKEKSFTIPDSVKSINWGGFSYSTLKSITIPYGVIAIGERAFYECNSLTSISIPDSVTSIGERAFYGCNSLTSMKLPFLGSTKNATSNACLNYLFSGSRYDDNGGVPDSLKKIIITGGEKIAENAFYECSSLTSITIPNTVTSIGSQAFYACSSLLDITIPKGVTSILSYTFCYCSSLSSVSIPNTVKYIDSDAFDGCTSLTRIKYGGSRSEWDDIKKRSYWDGGLGSCNITYHHYTSVWN